MTKSTKDLLRETIHTRLPCIESLLNQNPEANSLKLDDMLFTREYLENIVDLFKDVIENDCADYSALYDLISLDMFSNNKFWRDIKILSRILR